MLCCHYCALERSIFSWYLVITSIRWQFNDGKMFFLNHGIEWDTQFPDKPDWLEWWKIV
jgi:hypothetical protein